MIFKSKIIKLLLCFVFIFSLIFCTIKIFKHNESNNIKVNYVNKIESELYEKIKVYDYKDNTNQYEIKELLFTKSNIYQEIFYYYNDRFNYKVESISINQNNEVIINLNDENKNINLNDFKLVKLTYKQLNIKNIIINYKDKQVII